MTNEFVISKAFLLFANFVSLNNWYGYTQVYQAPEAQEIQLFSEILGSCKGGTRRENQKDQAGDGN